MGSLVHTLCVLVGPSAVVRGVSLVVVYPVQGEVWRIPILQSPLLELVEAEAPLVTTGDAPLLIVRMVPAVILVASTLLHAAPYVMKAFHRLRFLFVHQAIV